MAVAGLMQGWISGVAGYQRGKSRAAPASFAVLASARPSVPSVAVKRASSARRLDIVPTPTLRGQPSGLGMAAAVTLLGSAMMTLASVSLRNCPTHSCSKHVSKPKFHRMQLRAAEAQAMTETEPEYADEVENDDDDFGIYETGEDEYVDDKRRTRPLQARCKARFLKGSPLKFRRVLWQIRGRSYREALMLLEFLPWRHCKPTLKCLQSAAANAQNHFNMDKSRLYISRCIATKGPIMKRMRPVSKGQAHPYSKKTTHLTIWVAEMDDDQLEDFS
eukprot:CAMPEP_0179057328 /NCGR_PEP_ID=MMETSP0796-20121207/24278_1 /TAXON_ID=73915 /ORGANISM="Pyrodinium bahamense, Strain pbaha01" /LENGTH=275 /DNA_ID=CAMNT_0020754045 /DNA_START=210 /DNA_END=1037 /DNA_ORIENTATION=+